MKTISRPCLWMVSECLSNGVPIVRNIDSFTNKIDQRLFQGIPCAAAFAELHEVVIRGQSLYMHFDDVAVRTVESSIPLDCDFVAMRTA